MEITNTFSGGLNQAVDPQVLKPTEYLELFNGIRTKDGFIHNEKGTVIVGAFPDNTICIGTSRLDQEQVAFLYSSTGLHEIGIINPNGIYSTKLISNELNFDPTKPVTARGRKNFNGDRLVYFCDGLNPIRYLNFEDIPTGDIGSNLKLQLDSDFCKVYLNGITDDGSLDTGVKQYAVRLVTDSGNKTGIGFITNPIPVVDDEDGSLKTEYDGAYPNSPSSKAIKLDIKFIDSKYKFLEVLEITYEGTSNTPVIYSLGLTTVTSSTVQFKHYSSSQRQEEISLEELLQEFVNYDSASDLEILENTLLASGLTTISIDSEEFQNIANNCETYYTIKEVPISSSYNIIRSGNLRKLEDSSTSRTEYNSEFLSTNYKGFQRAETYSLALVPLFTNQRVGFAYHIPGKDLYTVDADTATKRLGSYVSQFLYPEDRGYPTGYIRHHRMPSINQEPLLSSDGSNIRIVGIKVTNIDTSGLSQDILDQLVGWALVYQPRTDENKSILAQGIAQPLTEVNQTATLSPTPFAGKSPWIHAFDVLPDNFARDTSESYVKRDYVAFYSPETTILEKNVANADYIRVETSMEGKAHDMYKRISQSNVDENTIHMLLDYNKHVPKLYGTITYLIKNKTQYVPAFVDAQIDLINEDTYNIGGRTNNGFVFLKTEAGTYPQYYVNDATKDQLPYKLPEISYAAYGDEPHKLKLTSTVNGTIQNSENVDSLGSTKRNLFNLYRQLNTQYGNLLDAEYVLLGNRLFEEEVTDSQGNILTNEELEFFNGDTFIGKYSVMSVYSENNKKDSDAWIQDMGLDVFTLNWFYCESTVNVNYRHYDDETLPYFPKYKILYSQTGGNSIFDIDPAKGHAKGYNRQYSFINSLTKYYPKPILFTEVTNYPNRIIYSEQSVEGEQFDAYRLFLPNNYTDISREYGNITGIFVHKNKLFAHTPLTTWNTFYNERIVQATSIGDVYVGNGGRFALKPQPVLTTTDGFAGSSSKFSVYTSPFGTLFYDDLKGKVYLFGDGLEEISNPALTEYLLNLNINDPLRVKTVYDNEYERFIITLNEANTLSFSVPLKSWTGFHNYSPTWYFVLGKRLFSISGQGIHVMNLGNYGQYYDVYYPLTLKLVVNEYPKITKTFDTLILNTKVTNSSEYVQPYETFDEVRFYTTLQNTGYKNIIVPVSFYDKYLVNPVTHVAATRVEGAYRIPIPVDYVVSIENNILDIENLVPFLEDPEALKFRPRLNDQYMIVDLKFNNDVDNKEITLATVSTLTRNSIL